MQGAEDAHAVTRQGGGGDRRHRFSLDQRVLCAGASMFGPTVTLTEPLSRKVIEKLRTGTLLEAEPRPAPAPGSDAQGVVFD